MEEIERKRNIIQQKLDHLVRAKNNSNHRKAKYRLQKELAALDQNSRRILTSKIENGNLTIEKFEVTGVAKYEKNNGHIVYPTMYAALDNEPAAFIEAKKILKNNIVENHVFGVEARKAERKYKKSKMNQVDANNDNEKNDEIIHAEEEEEDYEDIIIPKTKRIK